MVPDIIKLKHTTHRLNGTQGFTMKRIITSRTVAPLTFLFALACMVLFSSTAMAKSTRTVTVKKNKHGKVVKKSTTVSTRSNAHRHSKPASRHHSPKRVVTRKTVTRKTTKRSTRPTRHVTRTYIRPRGRVVPSIVRTPRFKEITTCTRVGRRTERCVTERVIMPHPDPRRFAYRGTSRRGVTLNIPGRRVSLR